MAIRTLADLRKKAPAELQNLSDRELVADYAQRIGADYGEALDYFRVPKRGLLGEMGSQALAGLTTDLPEMGARAIEYFAPEGSAPERYFRGIAEERAAAGQLKQADVRGRGLVGETFISGARALAPVVSTMATGLATGGVAAPAVASAALFGGSSAQETENKVLAAGGTKQEATRAGVISGLIQGVGETAATVAGAKLVMPFLKAGRAATTTARVAEEMTAAQTGGQILKNAFIYNPAIQGGTEVLQDIGTSLTERAYGVEAEDLGQLAAESLKGGIGLALILGPLGAVSSSVRSSKLREFDRALNSDTATPEERAQAQEAVRLAAEQQGISEEDRDAWLAEQIASETQLTIAHRELEDATNKLAEDPQNEEAQARVRAAFTIPTGVEITDPTTGEKRKGTVGEVLTYARPEGVQGELDVMAPVVMDADMFIRTVGSLGIAPAPQAPIDTADYFGVDRAALQDDLAAINNVDLSPEERSAALSRVANTVAQYKQEAKAAETAEPLPEPTTTQRTAAGKVYTTKAYTVRDENGKDVVINVTRDQDNRPTRARVVKGAAKESPKFGFNEDDKNRTDAQIINRLFQNRFSWGTQAPAAPVVATQTQTGAPTETIAIPTSKSGKITTPVQRYWYHSLRGRQPGAAGEITPYSRGKETEELLKEGFKEAPAGAVYLSPTPFDSDSVRVDIGKLDPSLMRLTGQAEGYAIYAGSIPASAIEAPATKQAAPVAKVEPEFRPEEVTDPTASEVLEPKTSVQAAADTVAIQKEIDRILEAGVQTGAKGKVKGRKSLPANVFAAIRNAVLSPTSGYFVRQQGSVKKDAAATEQYGEKIKAVSKAMRDFMWFYKDVLDAKLVIKGKKMYSGQEEAIAAEEATKKVGEVRASAEKAQAAYNNLLEALDGNKKDLDVLVRIIKDKVQVAKLDPRANPEHVAKWEKLDINLSRAVSEIAQTGETQPSLTFVRSDEVRPPREQQAEIDAIEKERQRLAESKKPEKRARAALAKREEALGKMYQLVDAAENGYAPYGKGKKEFGIRGVMNYFRSNGTQYEKRLSEALKYVFDNMAASAEAAAKINPKSPNAKELGVKFVKEGTPSYDPETNTITLVKTSSPEAVLHEALHGALQWFVHNNPKHPAVMALKDRLKEIVAYDSEKLGEKAKDVQGVLKKLVKSRRTNDAVLELISYGNTLQEFKQALDAMPVKTTPKTFVQAAQDIWKQILAVVKEIIGGKQTQATEVMNRTFELLTEAAQTPVVLAPKGKPLKAAVQSETSTREALGMSESDYRGFKKNHQQFQLSTKFLFDAVGWSRISDKMVEKSGELADYIRKKMPYAARTISLINARFSISDQASRIMDSFKGDKNTGYMQAELVAKFIQSRDANTVDKFMRYMDGETKALDDVVDGKRLKSLGDGINKWIETYKAELSPKERSYFQGKKFTEILMYPTDVKRVAGHSLRAVGISKMVGLQDESVPSFDGSREYLNLDANGDLDIGGKMYKATNPDSGRKDGKPDVIWVSVDKANKVKLPTGFEIDRTRVWEHVKYDKKGHVLRSSITYAQAIKEMSAEDRANALRNTMAGMAANYAARRFQKGIASLGYKGGKPTAESVVFSSVSDIEEAFKGVDGFKAPSADQIAIVSKAEMKAESVRNAYRTNGTWVQLSKDKNLGELSGKIIPGPVWVAMTDMNDRQPLVNFRPYNKLMSWFKKSKTTLNPGTHVTNVMTNVTLAIMHDLSYKQLSTAAQIYAKQATVTRAGTLTTQELRIIQDFMDSGAMLGDFSSAEIKESIYKSLQDNLNKSDSSVMKRGLAFLGFEQNKAQALNKLVAAGMKADEAASAMYAAEDNIFRLAMFMKTAAELQARDGTNKLTESQKKEAGRVARQAFLDYDIDSKAVRIARQTALPFISWPYAIMPVLGRIALRQPWKIANVLTSYAILSAALGAAAGDDDEQREEGPSYLRERMFHTGPYMHVRIPFLGDSENPVYYRLGDYIPLASAFRGVPNPSFNISILPQFLQPSSPLLSLGALMLNVDPYTGEPISDDTDTAIQKMWSSVRGAYDIVAPPLVSARNLATFDSIMSGDVGRTGAPVSGFKLAAALGFKFYQHNVDEYSELEGRIIRGIESDFKRKIAELKREEAQSGNPDYEKLDREIEKLYERMRERIKEETNEDM